MNARKLPNAYHVVLCGSATPCDDNQTFASSSKADICDFIMANVQIEGRAAFGASRSNAGLGNFIFAVDTVEVDIYLESPGSYMSIRFSCLNPVMAQTGRFFHLWGH